MPDKSKKIFISYGSKDHAYAKKIEDFLNKKGHKVWRDENKLSNAILWNQDIVEAINQNDCALLLWSSYAETRETIRQEIMTARALQKPIVIVLVPYEDHLPELPNVLRTIQAIRGKNDNQILEKILDRINDDQLKKVQYPLLTENLHIPNFRNEFFIGRENELSKLFFDLWGPLGKSSRNAPMVIRGMAGIGKTELANELAYRINIFYPGGVYWIDASGNHLEAKFAELAIELNLVTLEQAEHKLLAKQAINYLSKHNDILLIIDDIRNPDLLKDWLPKGARACTTLITTREFLFGYQTIELDILDEKSAFDLLVKHRRTINDKDDEIAAAKEICKLGGYHPKMLIGCAQELRTITAQDYLANMQNKTGASTRTQDIMNVSFDISYERVESSEKNDYFFLLGHFNTIEVDKEMIIYACDSPSVGMTVIQQLHDHTLISFGTSDQLIHVHPLVKDYSLFKQGYDNKDVIKRYIKVIESYVNKYADEQYIQKILSQAVNIEHAIELAKQNNILESYFNIVIYYCKHLGYQNKFDEALKYLLDLKKFIEQGEIRNKDILMNTYLELANVYYHKYEFKFSKKYYQKIYDIKTLPEPEKSDLYYGLGRIEFKEGNHDKAIQMFEKAKTILLDNCAESNPDVLKVEHAIALVEYEQNKFDDSLYRLEKIFALYDESQRLERAKILINICNGYRRQANFELAFDKINDAISILEKIYGSDHAIIADALEIKIKVLYHLSKFEEHLRLLNRILDIRQKAHTETHPAIGRTKYDFGNYYLRRGELDNAIKSFKESIEISLSNYGENNPETIEKNIDLAAALVENNDFKGALTILEKAEQAAKKVFWKKEEKKINDNYLTARIYMHFSNVYRRRGEFEKALEWINKSLTMKKQVYKTKDHPSYASSESVLIRTYFHQCEFAKALPILNHILNIRKDSFGESHPIVAETLFDFGNYYVRQGEYTTAIDKFTQAYEILKTKMGDNHPKTIEVNIELAAAKRENNEFDKALEILKKTEQSANIVYKNNDNYLLARIYMHYSHVYRKRGEFSEAEKWIEKSLEMKEKIYKSKDHPSYAKSESVRVRIFYHQCEFKKALSVLNHILQVREDRYGEHHPLVGNTLFDFGNYYSRMSDYEKAISYFKRAVKICKYEFGDNHPDTIERNIELASALHENAQFDDALSLLKDCEKAAISMFESEDNHLTARIYMHYSHVFRRKSEFHKALQHVQKSLDIKKKIYKTKDHPSYAKSESVLIRVYFHQCEFEESLPILNHILEIRKNVYGETHPFVGDTLFDFGNYYMQMSDYENAIINFQNSIGICQSKFGDNHPQTIERNIELAAALRESGEYEKSQSTLEKAEIAALTVFGDTDNYLTARILIHYSHYYRRKNDFKNALKAILQSLDMKERIYKTKDHTAYVMSEMVLVRLYYHTYEFEKAEEALNHIMKVRNEKYGDSHPFVANTLFYFGNYYLRKGEYAQAIEKYEQSIKINKTKFGDNHPHTLERNIELASALRQNGQYERAQTLLNEIENITQEIFNKRKNEIKYRLFFQQSLVYRRLSKFPKALDYIEKAIEIENDIFGKFHTSTAVALEIKAKILEQVYRLDDAQNALKQLLNIRLDTFGENHRRIANVYHEIGYLFNTQFNFSAALNNFEKAYEIYRNVYGESHPEIGRLFLDIGIAHRGLHRYNLAKDAFDKALVIDSHYFNVDHPYIARINTELGILFLVQDLALPAQDHLKSALSVFEKNPIQNYPDLAKTLKYLGDLYLADEMKNEARDYYDQALEIKNKIYEENHPEIRELKEALIKC